MPTAHASAKPVMGADNARDDASPSGDSGVGPEEAPVRHYHPIGIFFHWLMAALVLAQLWWGWRTSALAAGADKADAYVLHAQLGLLILVAALLRGGWRVLAPFIAPQLEKPEDMPEWQHRAAQLTHFALYAVMLVLPVSGLLMLHATAPDTFARATGLQGFDPLPYVAGARMEQAAQLVHMTSIWLLVLLLAAHIGAALKHHFVDGDDVLARMIPLLSRDTTSADDPPRDSKTGTARPTIATKPTR